MIDLTKILIKGQSVYSPLFGYGIVNSVGSAHINVLSKTITTFDRYGRYDDNGECVLFPDHLTKQWLKPGDIIISTSDSIVCVDSVSPDGNISAWVLKDNEWKINSVSFDRFATTCEQDAFEKMLKNYNMTLENLGHGVEHYTYLNCPFDLEPFDKVLVRDNETSKWKCAFLSHYDKSSMLPFKTTTMSYRCCIPYNDETKHLIGHSSEAPSKYVIW